MNATGKRRLLKLADFLETAKLPGTFYMGEWCHKVDNDRPACGTNACAIGWATTIPSFRRAGLTLSPWGDPMFGNLCGSLAAAEFFDISNGQAANFFLYHPGNPCGMTARRSLARRIKAFVAKHAAPANTTRPAR